MPITVLYSENVYGDDRGEREVYGPDIRVILADTTKSIADLPDADCAAADGLMLLRYRLSAADLAVLRARSPREADGGADLRHHRSRTHLHRGGAAGRTARILT